MYVTTGGRLFSAPFGSEYLGKGADGVPIAYWRAGFVGEMVEVTPKRTVD